MDIFLLLVALVTLIFILRKLTGIKYDISLLQNELQDLKKLISSGPLRPSEKQEPKTAPPAPVTPEPSVIPSKEEIKTVQWPERKRQVAGGVKQEAESVKPVYTPAVAKQSWFSKWLLDNPD